MNSEVLTPNNNQENVNFYLFLTEIQGLFMLLARYLPIHGLFQILYQSRAKYSRRDWIHYRYSTDK